MAFGRLENHYLGKPNDLTRAMGELVKQARLEAGFSQDGLAREILRRQATISDWENGKVELTASDLVHLSRVCEKPILFFFPEWTIQKVFSEEIPPDLQNLLLQARKLPKSELQKIIVQVKALVSFTNREINEE